MKKIIALGCLMSASAFANNIEERVPPIDAKLSDISLKGDASMPVGVMGYVQFSTVEGHVLHIGPGGICLYEQGKWQRWCK